MRTKDLVEKYKYFKSQLTENLGFEADGIEASWNDSIRASMEGLLEGVPQNIANLIRLNHI